MISRSVFWGDSLFLILITIDIMFVFFCFSFTHPFSLCAFPIPFSLYSFASPPILCTSYLFPTCTSVQPLPLQTVPYVDTSQAVPAVWLPHNPVSAARPVVSSKFLDQSSAILTMITHLLTAHSLEKDATRASLQAGLTCRHPH